MRKWFFAIGLIFLFIGVIFVLSSNSPYRRLNRYWNTVKTEFDKWQILGNFTEGDKIKLVVFYAADWGEYLRLHPDLLVYYKLVFVNITDPEGTESRFAIMYTTDVPGNPLYIQNVTLESPSNGLSQEGIDVSERQGNIVGKVLYSGLYNATVVQPYSPPGGGPPAALRLDKEQVTVVTEYPYSSYLYPGIVMFVLGVVLSIWGVRTPKRRVPIKRGTP